MTDEEQSKRLVRDFAWYHWGIVAIGSLDALISYGLLGAVVTGVLVVAIVAFLRVVWNEIRLYHRRAVEDARA